MTTSDSTTHTRVVTAARDYLMGLQSRITGAIAAKDGGTFLVDARAAKDLRSLIQADTTATAASGECTVANHDNYVAIALSSS